MGALYFSHYNRRAYNRQNFIQKMRKLAALKCAGHFQPAPKYLKQPTTDFVIEWNGAPVKRIRIGLNTAVRKARVKGVSPHLFRYTAAVWLAKSRIARSEVPHYLSHSSIAVTEKIYARFPPDYLRGAAETPEITPRLAGKGPMNLKRRPS